MHQNEVCARIILYMKDEYHKLFSKIKDPETPEGLYEAVMQKIGQAARRGARAKSTISGTAILVSLAGVFAGVPVAYAEFSESNFFNYLSLLFTDSAAVLSAWKGFLLSLLESAPFFGMTLTLGVVFVLLLSIRLFLKNMRASFTSSRLFA